VTAAGFQRYFFLARVRRLPPLERDGTLPPERRASDSPIAMACLRLVTFLPERPLRNDPVLRSCIARFTFVCAFFPYLAAMTVSSMLDEAKPCALANLARCRLTPIATRENAAAKHR
jgi:hypothetical protein